MPILGSEKAPSTPTIERCPGADATKLIDHSPFVEPSENVSWSHNFTATIRPRQLPRYTVAPAPLPNFSPTDTSLKSTTGGAPPNRFSRAASAKGFPPTATHAKRGCRSNAFGKASKQLPATRSISRAGISATGASPAHVSRLWLSISFRTCCKQEMFGISRIWFPAAINQARFCGKQAPFKLAIWLFRKPTMCSFSHLCTAIGTSFMSTPEAKRISKHGSSATRSGTFSKGLSPRSNFTSRRQSPRDEGTEANPSLRTSSCDSAPRVTASGGSASKRSLATLPEAASCRACLAFPSAIESNLEGRKK
mmetsp:Transcript_28556/g.72314  ORF Transcript_28556/g.72314 Transcript_28556/m.72314 type:complete len:308 (-) Transcript_28556:46-969(-)